MKASGNFCVDCYHKTWKAPPVPWRPPAPQPRRIMAATQAGRFTIRGPSSGGPLSVATIYGIIWAGDEDWSISSGGPGQNLGLG
jgi:hypothetical protein